MSTVYDTLLSAATCQDSELKAAYRQLRELLEELCLSQMEGEAFQKADLAARINYVAVKQNLSLSAQHRLHTFRLTSNAILNREEEPTRASLLRDVKTLAFFQQSLTGASVPPILLGLLPKADATYISAPPAVRRVKRLRVSYSHRDEQFLYVQSLDEPQESLLRIRYGIEDVNVEFGETVSLLWPLAILNLLDVGIDAEGILTPGVIVLEPDYLLDISSLAACYKDYGHHPANYLLSRLSLSQNTAAMLIGDIANLFLDEWIYSKEAPDYQTCMQKAFRKYPLELVTCEELNDATKENEFFAKCKQQFQNIRQTVEQTFLAEGYQLQKADAVLEPSFICEALGLQGRLDYMQRDMDAFIEMKSGKAEEYKVSGKILLKESHQVQMQLYQAVLEYSMGKDHRHTRAYLLYSRYPYLYPARPSWALLRRVINLRNQIVATEYAIQQTHTVEFTAQCLAQINPEELRQNAVGENFWTRYLQPQISWLPEKLAELSALERSYFYTLYLFITKELYTSKAGGSLYDMQRGAASLWLSTLEEKEEAGEIVCPLELIENQSASESKPFVRLRRTLAEKSDSLPNFRQGDSVVLYQRNLPTDNVTCQQIFKGNLEDITEDVLTVRLRMPQRNPKVLPSESLYAIERDYMDTSFTMMFSGLAAFLSASKERRALLLCQSAPRHDASFEPLIAAETDAFKRISLKAQAAEDYFLLIGPPGTGKTSMALRTMVEDFYRDGNNLLLLSYTNRAVDEICKMLEHCTPVPDYIRIGSELNCEEAYRAHLLENVLEGLASRKAVRSRLEQCRIYVATVSTLSSKTELFQLKQFDVALIDEATQILEPQLLGLLCARRPDGAEAIRKFVLIGDHKQLPAVVQQDSSSSAVTAPALQAIGLTNLKDSLFERLYRGLSDNYCFDMLCRQGRMHQQVSDFANVAFYESKLEPVGLPHQHDVLAVAPGLQGIDMAWVLDRRVAFLPSVAEPPLQSCKHNHAEAVLVARLARAIFKQYTVLSEFEPLQTLGIITPYRSQIALIRQELASLGIAELQRVTVDTVERYQGSERDVIIYSCCMNHLRQVEQLACLTEDHGVQIDRKLNVALTRARKQLFITGVPEVLSHSPIYTKLMAWAGYHL
ncbi:MAG: DNA2/NAM7 family helicase [Bacteroidaceae bacterium]|nr:DNA2/NAM7 family helicase [Bacteroidaceae bacterium]